MRRYPESGPERRDREEYQRKAYGEGEYLAEKCQRCKQPFSASDIAEKVNVVRRHVFTSRDNPTVREDGAICTTCQLKERVERLEQDKENERQAKANLDANQSRRDGTNLHPNFSDNSWATRPQGPGNKYRP